MALQTQDMSYLEEEPFGIQNVRDSLSKLVQSVVEECQNYNKHFSVSKNVIFAGFSQGAIVSVDLSLHMQEIPRALVLLSGGIVCKNVWEKNASKLKATHVFQSHGTEDPILPFAVGKILNQFLTQAGAQVTFVQFQGGHHLNDEVSNGLNSFLSKITK